MTERFDLAIQPKRRCPKPDSGVCAASIAQGAAVVLAMQPFTLGAVDRGGSSAT